MQQDDIVQVRVGKSQVGVMGLKTAMEDMAETYGERSDPEVMEELLNRLSKKNYIPPHRAGGIQTGLFAGI